jgi:hypothetical protein
MVFQVSVRAGVKVFKRGGKVFKPVTLPRKSRPLMAGEGFFVPIRPDPPASGRVKWW